MSRLPRFDRPCGLRPGYLQCPAPLGGRGVAADAPDATPALLSACCVIMASSAAGAATGDRTPVPIVQKLREATVATIATPAVQEKLKELGYVLVAPERRLTEYLGKFVESEVEKWAAAIKAANIKPE